MSSGVRIRSCRCVTTDEAARWLLLWLLLNPGSGSDKSSSSSLCADGLGEGNGVLL